MSVANPGPDAAALARSASQVLEPVFERLERLAGAVVASRPAGSERGSWSASDADQVRPVLLALIAEDRLAVGITPGTVRLSVGLEDVQDLIEDFDRALGVAFG